MALSETTNEFVGGSTEYATPFVDEQGLVLIPDQVTEIDGKLVAGFREGSQALRVEAIEADIPVALAMPQGAVPGQYSEHAADWILPLILAFPAGDVVATLLSNYLQRKIDDWRSSGRQNMPTVKHREVRIGRHGQPTTIREIEGPADEVVRWYREIRAIEEPDSQGPDGS